MSAKKVITAAVEKFLAAVKTESDWIHSHLDELEATLRDWKHTARSDEVQANVGKPAMLIPEGGVVEAPAVEAVVEAPVVDEVPNVLEQKITGVKRTKSAPAAENNPE